jgi:lipopolysaccharide transport system permease protein
MSIVFEPGGRLATLQVTARAAAMLASRDLRTRYARSYLGMLWFLLTPVSMLAIYWGVFGLALGVSWPGPQTTGPIGFILPFTVGLTVYLFVAEIVTSSLPLFYNKRNFVKRSPFSIWSIWLSNYFRCCFLASFNLVLLLLLTIWYGRLTTVGLAYAIPVIVGILLVAAALSMIMSALGAFLADLANIAQTMLRILFYSAPITYPISLIPERWQPLLWANPLTSMIEPLREALVFGTAPAAAPTIAVLAIGGLATLLSAWLFDRASTAIPDVV